jgi:hypothetical protein
MLSDSSGRIADRGVQTLDLRQFQLLQRLALFKPLQIAGVRFNRSMVQRQT